MKVIASNSIITTSTRLFDKFLYETPPHKPILPARYIINTFKGGELLVCLICMFIYNNFSTRAVLYTALHGSYGIIWVLKDLILPDASFQRKLGIPAILIMCGGLSGYLFIGPYTISRTDLNDLTNLRFITACLSYMIGQFLMIGADTQKYFTLKYKKGLISTGFFYNTRNPNYLGEILIYLSFGILAESYIAYSILLIFWTILFHTNMVNKETSLMKKDGYTEYHQRSYYLLPRFFNSEMRNVTLYVFCFVIGCVLYHL